MQFVYLQEDFLEIARDDNFYAVATVELEHYMIHQGRHYFVSDFEVKNTDDTINFGIVVPAGNVPHITCKIGGTAQTEVKVFEESTFSGGSPVTAVNSNRNSNNVSALSLSKDPTVAVSGSQLSSCSVGATGANLFVGDSTGIEERGNELVLGAGKNYRVEITSKGDTNTITYLITWYE